MNLSRSILTQFLNVSGRVNTNDIPSFSAGMSRWCSQQDPSRDKLFKSIKIEVRGHDSAVLDSYTIFLRNVCANLEIEYGKVVAGPYIKWLQYALKSKFAKKKYKVHYESRTYVRAMPVYHLTGSTASTFLEYIQRNIPEGVAMKVSYEEIEFLPESIREIMENQQPSINSSPNLEQK